MCASEKRNIHSVCKRNTVVHGESKYGYLCNLHKNEYFCECYNNTSVKNICVSIQIHINAVVPVYLAMFSSSNGYLVSLCISAGMMSFSCSLRHIRLLSASCTQRKL